MFSSCDIRLNGKPCRFWTGHQCADPVVYIHRITGVECCRYHEDAVCNNSPTEETISIGDIKYVLAHNCDLPSVVISDLIQQMIQRKNQT